MRDFRVICVDFCNILAAEIEAFVLLAVVITKTHRCTVTFAGQRATVH